ncbi:MAG: anaerobic ribonucleoside-triphosphate reductase activating protein [Candidatus Omnitrophica bacterium]|nr:anaerobic ribonucleoside-triphosphate reductase activating protein [Candidatus Omnitrophota bacterium]
MEIKGFTPASFIDYPGKVAAVIWTPGCNFRCPFCYNVDLVRNQPSLPAFSEAEILKHLQKEKDFLDGLVVTGGEPTLQPDLIDFLIKIKKENIPVKLDTNGSRPEVLEKLINQGLVSYIALDIKAPLQAEQYSRVSGIDIEYGNPVLSKVIATIDLLADSGVEYELRTTIAPGLLTEDDFLEIGRFCKARKNQDVFPGCYVIQNFFPAPTLDQEFSAKKSWEKERLEALREKMRVFFREVQIRGR